MPCIYLCYSTRYCTKRFPPPPLLFWCTNRHSQYSTPHEKELNCWMRKKSRAVVDIHNLIVAKFPEKWELISG